MGKRLGIRLGAVALGAVLAAPAVQAEGIEFHGYVRVGVGGTSEGGNLQCFQGPFPVRAKYRLGNECDNYAEPSITLPFGDTDKVWAKYKLTVALQHKGTQDAESTIGTDDDPAKFNLLHREQYIYGGGFFPKGSALENAVVWIGQRFYNRHDIHMNDHYYWSNSGPGAGIEEIPLGKAKMGLAYFQNGGNSNAVSTIASKRVSFRFYDLDVNPGGKLEGDLNYVFGSTAGTAEEGNGFIAFLKHTQSGVLGGFNHLALVVGKDQGAGFEWLPTFAGGGEQKGSAWRIHDHLYFDFKGTPWTGTATVSYATWNPDGPDKFTWVSFGVRPQYNFTDTQSVAFELGYDQGKNGDGPTAKLAKATIAGQLSLSRGVWARPVLRAFATYAKWNTAAGTQANGVFGDKKNGITYGLQAEAWW